MFEKLVVLFSLLVLYAFCGVVLVYVAEPELIIVFLVCLGIATYDFWISLFKPKPRRAEREGDAR